VPESIGGVTEKPASVDSPATRYAPIRTRLLELADPRAFTVHIIAILNLPLAPFKREGIMSKLVIYAAIIFVGVVSLDAFAAETRATGVVIKQVPLTYKDVALNNGHEMYDNLCAVCHGLTGKGDGPAAPALNNSVPDLTQFKAKTGSQYHAQLESTISGINRSVHKDIVGMPLWFREFQYVRRDKFGRPRTMYANLKVHSLAEYVEELALARTD